MVEYFEVVCGDFGVVCGGLQGLRYFNGPALVESLDKTCTWYKMEISAKKTKLMTYSANGIQREIKVFRGRSWAL